MGPTMTRSAHIAEPQVMADPHGLIASGEPLATVPELARMLGCSGKALHAVLNWPLYRLVPFVRYRGAPSRYSTAAARIAIEPHRAEIEERRQRAQDLETRERAARAQRDAARPAPRLMAEPRSVPPKGGA